jgi:ABC-2 type transport system permease protein
MAMLVASGVNRTRLFFSKIGATLLWSLCVTIVLVFIPGFIVLLKISQTTGMFQMISQLLELMNINSLSIFGVSFTFLNSYLNTLILISAATILMKGRNLTILVYFGFNIAQSMILGFLAFIPSAMDFSNTGISIFNNLTMILVSCGMILLSLRIMKKQNL